MNTSHFILAVLFLLALAAPYRAMQTKGGRESSPVNESKDPARAGAKGTPRARSPKRPSRAPTDDGGRDRKLPPATAMLSIRVTPADSTINLQGVEHRAENGLFFRSGLTPGTYKIFIRRDGYRGEEYDISLESGNQPPLIVSLEPLNGILNVTPPVADTEIRIVELTTGKRVGDYSGRAHRVELPPGRYQVLISKEGYQSTSREVVIEPTKHISLEPSLSPLPKPAALRASPPFRRDAAMQAQTRMEGKFIVVLLTGRSGDMTNAFGAIDVTVSVSGGQVQTIGLSGMLTGYPCQVDFVRLENVGEYSFVEPPGISNQWARAIVRLRPKDSKRPMHFLINWKSLRSAIPEVSPTN